MAGATSGPGGPEQRGSPKYVPAAPCWPWETGLVGLTQLFGSGQGPSRDWGRNCFLLCVHLGWKKREAGGEPRQAPRAAGAMGHSLGSSGRPCCCHFAGKTGRDSPPDACRVLKPPYSVHSRRPRTFRGPQLLGPQCQPSLCRCLALSPWPRPLAGTAGMVPAAGLSRLHRSLGERLLHPYSPGAAAVAAEHGHPMGASG